MTTDLATLLASKTEAEINAEQLADLQTQGFPVTAWQVGGVARTLVKIDAKALASVHVAVGAVARGSFLDLAVGAWLDLHAQSRFDLTRILATYARGQCVLACLGSAGPYTIPPAGLLVTDTATGHRYRSTNTGNVNVPSGGTVTIEVSAEQPGSDYNIAASVDPEHSALRIVTPALAGLSVSNPALSGSDTWQTITARDTETDSQLRARCKARWAVLGFGATRDAYRFHLLSAVDEDGVSCGITRVAFAAVPGDGTVPIYVAGASGPITSGQRADAATYLSTRIPITDTPVLTIAAEATLSVNGTVKFRAGRNTAANQSAVRNAVRACVNSLDIGDTNGVDEAAVKAAIYAAVPGGIIDVDLGAPLTADVVVAAGTVAVADTTGLNFTT